MYRNRLNLAQYTTNDDVFSFLKPHEREEQIKAFEAYAKAQQENEKAKEANKAKSDKEQIEALQAFAKAQQEKEKAEQANKAKSHEEQIKAFEAYAKAQQEKEKAEQANKAKSHEEQIKAFEAYAKAQQENEKAKEANKAKSHEEQIKAFEASAIEQVRNNCDKFIELSAQDQCLKAQGFLENSDQMIGEFVNNTQIISQPPNYFLSNVYYARAIALKSLNHHRLALEEISKSIEYNPNKIQARIFQYHLDKTLSTSPEIIEENQQNFTKFLELFRIENPEQLNDLEIKQLLAEVNLPQTTKEFLIKEHFGWIKIRNDTASIVSSEPRDNNTDNSSDIVSVNGFNPVDLTGDDVSDHHSYENG